MKGLRIIGLAALVASVTLAAAPGSRAQTDEAGLVGTLAKIAERGAVVIAARDDAAPFSFRDRAGRPVGYSIDLCAAIVEEIGRSLGRDDLRIEFLPVTAESRLAAVIEGRADLECGSTTANLDRAKEVSFSPLVFVAGTRVLVKKGTPWRDFHDLAGKRIAVTTGTTNLDAMKRMNETFALNTTLVESADHEAGYRLLEDGKVDGLATDDVLLAGLVARHRAGDRFEIVGEKLSYDPYGIVYAHEDAGMQQAIERAFETLAAANDLDAIYDRWFNRRLPNGETLGMPMGPELEQAFAALRGSANADSR